MGCGCTLLSCIFKYSFWIWHIYKTGIEPRVGMRRSGEELPTNFKNIGSPRHSKCNPKNKESQSGFFYE